MLSLLVYIFCFCSLFFITKQEYKIPCFMLVVVLSFQLILSYYVVTNKIQDILFYLVMLSFLDLIMVSCIIANNIIIKEYNILMSIVAMFAVFSTLLSVFNYYDFYYFQYSPMIIMEYLYFSIKQQQKYTPLYYTMSLLLVVPHLIT